MRIAQFSTQQITTFRPIGQTGIMWACPADKIMRTDYDLQKLFGVFFNHSINSVDICAGLKASDLPLIRELA